MWQQAHDVLAAANQIRILGYSLPVADAYIKYLLKSAVITAPNLKRIDIICRDGTEQVVSRYKDFVRFRYARFSNADVLQYLSAVRSRTLQGVTVVHKDVGFNRLELAHEAFFDKFGAALH